jgi:hypothetical protein
VRPYAEWDFEKGAEDLLGRLPLTLLGGARVEGGALVLDGNQSAARSAPLPTTLKAKTLEAWVQLQDLTQQGGGVMTVQDLRGGVFDSIVYGEKTPARWLAGSDHHRRTQAFEGLQEMEAAQRPVHVAVVWAKNGRTTAYRDGQEYGNFYVAQNLAEFTAGNSEVLLGCRHGRPAGNRVLRGRILRARLYDRALTGAEVERTVQVEASVVTERQVLAALDPAQRTEAEALKDRAIGLRQRMESLQSQAGSEGNPGLTALALSLFSLKEAVYLR